MMSRSRNWLPAIIRAVLLLTAPIARGKTVCYDEDRICVTAVDSGDNVNFTIRAETNGWVAVGLNTVPQMDGADVMMAWTNADGSVTLSDRHNIGYAGSAIDPQQDLQLHAGSGRNKSAGAPANAHVYHFSRPYFTNDTRDMIIQRTSAQFWIFAYAGERPASDDPSAPVSVHIWKEAPAAQDLLDDDTAMDDPAEPDGNAGDEVDAGVVGNSHSYDEAATSEYAFALPHGILMFIAFSVLIPAGVFVAVVERESQGAWWFRVHWLTIGLGMLFMAAGWIFMIQRIGHEYDGVHSILGVVTILTCILVQLPLGIYIHLTWNPQRRYAPIRDRAHWWIGRTLGALSIAATYTGLVKIGASTELRVWYGVYIVGAVVIGALVVVGTLRARFAAKRVRLADTEDADMVRV